MRRSRSAPGTCYRGWSSASRRASNWEYSMGEPIQKRVALVTGASRGIGRAIAIALGQDGLFVVVNYTANEAAAAETLAKIKEAGGDGALSRFDVADAAAGDAAVKQ